MREIRKGIIIATTTILLGHLAITTTTVRTPRDNDDHG